MTALVLGLTVLAGLACPAHMWWSHRRGRHAACCAPNAQQPTSMAALQARQRELAAQIAQYDADSAPG